MSGTCTNCGRPNIQADSRECRACVSWRRTHHGERRPDNRPTTRRDRPDNSVTSSEMCTLTGCTFRQLDLWCRTGRITPSLQGGEGTGTVRLWTDEDVELVAAVVQRIGWGMTVEAAFRPVDPPLPRLPERVSA